MNDIIRRLNKKKIVFITILIGSLLLPSSYGMQVDRNLVTVKPNQAFQWKFTQHQVYEEIVGEHKNTESMLEGAYYSICVVSLPEINNLMQIQRFDQGSVNWESSDRGHNPDFSSKTDTDQFSEVRYENNLNELDRYLTSTDWEYYAWWVENEAPNVVGTKTDVGILENIYSNYSEDATTFTYYFGQNVTESDEYGTRESASSGYNIYDKATGIALESGRTTSYHYNGTPEEIQEEKEVLSYVGQLENCSFDTIGNYQGYIVLGLIIALTVMVYQNKPELRDSIKKYVKWLLIALPILGVVWIVLLGMAFASLT